MRGIPFFIRAKPGLQGFFCFIRNPPVVANLGESGFFNGNDIVPFTSSIPAPLFAMIRHYFFAAISILFLLNFTMGVFEIPDNLPIVGNLDEVAASLLLFQSIRQIREAKSSKQPSGRAAGEP